jgi:acyl-CoA thioesterase
VQTLKEFFEGDQFAKRNDIELISVAPGRATARMIVRPHHWNGLGSVQGGAVFTLADFAFAAASNSYGTAAVAINVSITFMKGIKEGALFAEATELSKNHRLGSYQVQVKDAQGELVAIFQGLAYRKQDKLPFSRSS